ncbi:hypothetical protein EDD85DRAFT_847477 [Armillaria nabsnona]|nr:hypothetical protein EDD85DRAFT_847477 [Armillaria nabsnona]
MPLDSFVAYLMRSSLIVRIMTCISLTCISRFLVPLKLLLSSWITYGLALGFRSDIALLFLSSANLKCIELASCQ